ncbi:hypothetical protein D3C87_1663040 [compost metagenome]
MKHLILVAALALAGFSASAGELDNESSVTNQSMNGTIVVRVDTRTNAVAVLATDAVMQNNHEAQALAQESTFSPMPAKNLAKELDQDGGASSWYWYGGYNQYYYSSMYYYGNWYNPCYNYNWGYYRYYYYSNCWW